MYFISSFLTGSVHNVKFLRTITKDLSPLYFAGALMHCVFEAKDRERKNRGAAIIFNLMSDGLSLPIFMNTLSHRAPKFWAPMKGEKERERERLSALKRKVLFYDAAAALRAEVCNLPLRSRGSFGAGERGEGRKTTTTWMAAPCDRRLRRRRDRSKR